jgi:hypothetical protein
MGYLGYFYLEKKAHEIRSNVQGGVQLAEKSKGKTSSVIMAWPTIFWLVSAWDYLTNSELVRENWRTFRFGCFSYIMQRRKNSYGNYLELSEYGGKGRRSFVIIPEGHQANGWEDCRIQLQRLKAHFEKQKEQASSGGALEGTKTVGKMSGLSKETPHGGNHVQRSYAEAVAGEKGKDDDSRIQVAGRVVPKPFMEGVVDKGIVTGQLEMGLERARFMAMDSRDHVQHQKEIMAPQHTGVDLHGLKTILVALQSEIASCLQKLEMG